MDLPKAEVGRTPTGNIFCGSFGAAFHPAELLGLEGVHFRRELHWRAYLFQVFDLPALS